MYSYEFLNIVKFKKNSQITKLNSGKICSSRVYSVGISAKIICKYLYTCTYLHTIVFYSWSADKEFSKEMRIIFYYFELFISNVDNPRCLNSEHIQSRIIFHTYFSSKKLD